MRWCRLYSEFATDPKVQVMPEAMQRRLIMIFCFQSEGCLAAMDDETLACAMRITTTELQKTKELFAKKGFIEGDTWLPRNWGKRQRSSDDGNERVKRFREQKQRDGNGVVTLQKLSQSVERNEAFFRAPASAAAPLPSESVSVSESESRGSPEGDAEPAHQAVAGRIYSADEDRVANLAMELGGDFSWGIWAGRQFTMGISPAELEAALEAGVNADTLSQPYVAKIAARFKRDGLPKPSSRGKAKQPDPGPTNMAVSAHNPPPDIDDFAPDYEKHLAMLRAKGQVF